MKSPPRQLHDDVARQRVEAFIRGEDDETLAGRGGESSARAATGVAEPIEGAFAVA
jgi:hypothetical protein